MHAVDFYFDFISPYAWLALAQAEDFAAEHRVEFQLQPVVYAALLDATGLVGPAEEPSKRHYIFTDVLRSARALGLRVDRIAINQRLSIVEGTAPELSAVTCR